MPTRNGTYFNCKKIGLSPDKNQIHQNNNTPKSGEGVEILTTEQNNNR